MIEFFRRSKADDSALKLEMQALNNGTVCETLSIEIESVALVKRENIYVGSEFMMNKGVAETCKRFFDENNNKGLSVVSRLFFGSNKTFYYCRYVNYVWVMDCITSGSAVMVRMNSHTGEFFLCVNGNYSMDLTVPEQSTGAQPIEKNEIREIVTKCMEIQRNDPPRKLTPMEQMKLRASGMFTSAPSAPAKKEKQSESATPGAAIFDPSTLKVTQGSKDYKKELENIIGLDDVKEEFEKMVIAHKYQLERAQRLGTSVSQNSMHMCFLGAPGTGKTSIARVVAGYLYSNGLIRNNECIEISGLDLVANYSGQTSDKTRIILERAKGGVIFIDEAYAIAEDLYGREAIDVLLKEIEDSRGELVVIFAGYERDMSRFLDMNEGFKSRINRYFHFANYDPKELSVIFMKMLKGKNLVIEADALEEVVSIFARECTSDSFSNGRFVRNLVEKIEDRHIYNVRNRENNERINVVSLKDVLEA